MATATLRPPIRFKFDPEKFVACLAFFADKTKGLDKLKAAKLMYYADKYHLLRYGRPIVGDVYLHWQYGPVPFKGLGMIHEAVTQQIRGQPHPHQDLLKKYVRVNFDKPYPLLELKHTPDLAVLSESECEALQQTVERYGRYSGLQLMDLTHHEATWNKTEPNTEID